MRIRDTFKVLLTKSFYYRILILLLCITIIYSIYILFIREQNAVETFQQHTNIPTYTITSNTDNRWDITRTPVGYDNFRGWNEIVTSENQARVGEINQTNLTCTPDENDIGKVCLLNPLSSRTNEQLFGICERTTSFSGIDSEKSPTKIIYEGDLNPNITNKCVSVYKNNKCTKSVGEREIEGKYILWDVPEKNMYNIPYCAIPNDKCSYKKDGYYIDGYFGTTDSGNLICPQENDKCVVEAYVPPRLQAQNKTGSYVITPSGYSRNGRKKIKCKTYNDSCVIKNRIFHTNGTNEIITRNGQFKYNKGGLTLRCVSSGDSCFRLIDGMTYTSQYIDAINQANGNKQEDKENLIAYQNDMVIKNPVDTVVCAGIEDKCPNGLSHISKDGQIVCPIAGDTCYFNDGSEGVFTENMTEEGVQLQPELKCIIAPEPTE
jgi:hypothetical protein